MTNGSFPDNPSSNNRFQAPSDLHLLAYYLNDPQTALSQYIKSYQFKPTLDSIFKQEMTGCIPK